MNMPSLSSYVVYSKSVLSRKATWTCIGIYDREELEEFIENWYGPILSFIIGCLKWGRNLFSVLHSNFLVYAYIWVGVHVHKYLYVYMHAQMCAAEYKFMLAHTCGVQRITPDIFCLLIRQDPPLELHQVG